MSKGAPASEPSLAQLKWRCRRGMLELDVFLQRFLERGYDELDAAGRNTFIELLDYPDQELLELLLGQIHALDPRHEALAERVRYIAAEGGQRMPAATRDQ